MYHFLEIFINNYVLYINGSIIWASILGSQGLLEFSKTLVFLNA